ncbi:MAG: glycosyltransferase [Gemmatimonadaceae bacterium]|nr:glycosyltransferase [Gemmatimonadaceae bacterium]
MAAAPAAACPETLNIVSVDPIAAGAVALPLVVGGYAYVGYPISLAAIRLLKGARRVPTPHDVSAWPEITITVPCYNEERGIAAAIDRLLALDYPADRRHILVLSDASTDRTDEIVRSYADRGVELLRLPARGGKSAAENAAYPKLRGTLVVNTDATTVIPAHALKPLVAAFQDPTVGVASGRDVSIAAVQQEQSGGEAGYVGYEMWVRGLETAVDGIIGASGCFYGIRRDLYPSAFPEHLSRDFGSPLLARAAGYRAVSVESAVCGVPRTGALQQEYRRKVRTMARGLRTLWYQRALLNPLRYGWFAWMLASHKLARWLVYPASLVAAAGLAVAATRSLAALVLAAAAVAVLGLGWLGWQWPKERRAPKLISSIAFIVASNVAGVAAWWRALSGQQDAVWEPTRRAG